MSDSGGKVDKGMCTRFCFSDAFSETPGNCDEDDREAP